LCNRFVGTSFNGRDCLWVEQAGEISAASRVSISSSLRRSVGSQQLRGRLEADTRPTLSDERAISLEAAVTPPTFSMETR